MATAVKVVIFLLRTHQNECHNFLFFLTTHKLQTYRINLSWWWLNLVQWLRWNIETLSFYISQYMVLRLRYILTRHPLFHTFTVVINTCPCTNQIKILRIAKVRWLVEHQIHQSEILWLIHGWSKWWMLQKSFIELNIGIEIPLSCAWHHQKMYQNCLAVSLTMLGTVRAKFYICLL